MMIMISGICPEERLGWLSLKGGKLQYTHRVSPTNKSGGAPTYSDFIGNALSNTTSAQTNITYSVDGTNYYPANGDGSFPTDHTQQISISKLRCQAQAPIVLY